MVRFTLRRRVWIRWLPPMDSASPSPVTTHTERSGRAAARPVAIAGARLDGVHPVGVHVVGEAGGAADPGDDDHVLAGDAQAGQEALHRVEDDVVTAPRAPADLLIGLEVLGLEPGQLLADAGRGGDRVAPRHTEIDGGHFVPPLRAAAGALGPDTASMASCRTAASSAARKGSPRTWVWLCTSMRNFARSSSASWPRFISGQITRSYWPRILPRSAGTGLRCRRWICAIDRPELRICRQAAPIGP